MLRTARAFLVGSFLAWSAACGSSQSDSAKPAGTGAGQASGATAGGPVSASGHGGAPAHPEGGRAGSAIAAGTGALGGVAGSGSEAGRTAAGDAGMTLAGGASAGSSSGEAGAGNVGGEAGSAGTCGSPPAVLFVVDTSLSMDEALPSRMSKWEVTSAVVASAVDALPDGMRVGLTFFPQVPQPGPPCFEGSLAVPVAPLDAAQRTRWRNALASVQVDGGTPTFDAYAYAEQQIAPLRDAGPTVMVLVTDGLPSYGLGCTGDGLSGETVDWAPLVPMVDAAAQAGTYTLAVAAPDSAVTHEMLTALAGAGEPPGLCARNFTPGCFFDLDLALDLGPWLAESLSLAAGCSP